MSNSLDYSLPGSSVHGMLQARNWSGLSCPPPGDLPDPGIELQSLTSPALAGDMGGVMAHAVPPGKTPLKVCLMFSPPTLPSASVVCARWVLVQKKEKVLCHRWKNKGNQCLYFRDSVLLNQGCYIPCATLAKFLNFQNCFPLLKVGSSHHTGLAQSH